MSVRLRLVVKGNLPQFIDGLPKVYAQATTAVVKSKTGQLKNALRRDVVRAGLGSSSVVRNKSGAGSTRLANTIRGETTPRRGADLRATGHVFSSARYKRGSGEDFDLIALFDTTTTIRSRNGQALAIPTAAAGNRRTPRQWPRNLLFLHRARHGGNAYLAAKDDPLTPIFILVRSVTIRKRLNVLQTYERVVRNIDQRLASNMERRATTLAKRLSR